MRARPGFVAHAGRLFVLPRAGPWQPHGQGHRAANEVWRETMPTSPMTRIGGPSRLSPAPRHQARDPGRRGLVRRGGPERTLQTYKTIERVRPGLRNSIVMGPGSTGLELLAGGKRRAGAVRLQRDRAYFQEKIELPFFNYY